MDLQLVSVGDDVKIWESADFVLTRQLNPHNQNVAGVCWAADNSFLASVSVHTEDVVLTYMKNFETSTVHTGAGCMCIDINDTSRYMLSGGSDGFISVWDLRTNKVRKTYKDHKGPVTSARFGQGSNVIAAGSETGEIIIYNVVTGQGCRPLVTPNIQAIKQVQFSRHKKSLLGSVCDDGSVNLWDTNRRQMVHSFACHRAPTTGLSFSPINDIFLMSVGLDKKIACHDVQSKKVVKIISADSPLTSIDTKGDGVTVVVGTTRGKIFHYDLRMSSAPVRSIDAHKSSVQGLRFQVENKVEKSSSKPLSTKQQLKNQSRQLPVSPRADYGAGEAQEVTTRTPASGSGLDVFSPLREGHQDQSSEEMNFHTSAGASLDNVTNNTRNNTGENGYSGGVFSPLNEGVGRGSGSGIGLSPLAYNSYPLSEHQNNVSGPTLMDYNRINIQQTEPPEVKVTHPSADFNSLDYNQLTSHIPSSALATSETSPHSSGSQSHLDIERLPSSEKHVAFQSDADQYAFLTNGASSSGEEHSPESKRQRHVHNQQVGRSASPSLPSMHLDSLPNSMHLDDSPGSAYGGGQNRFPSTPEGVNPQSHVSDRTSPVHSVRHETRTTANHVKSDSSLFTGDAAKIAEIVRVVVQEELSNFKKDMCSILRDEVDEMVDQLHRDIINLQVEMLRQFQLQQAETLQLLERYSVNPDLVSEVQRLQEEIKRLKRIF